MEKFNKKMNQIQKDKDLEIIIDEAKPFNELKNYFRLLIYVFFQKKQL